MATICVDFDGVIHSYATPWVRLDVIPDPPTEGAFDWIEAMLAAGLEVVVCSVRAEKPAGREAIRAWFLEHGLAADVVNQLGITNGKPPAVLYVDDRAWRFDGPGSWPTPSQVEAFRPWNRR